eukprot:gene35844-46527_t
MPPLPYQIIHGDLHYDNILVNESKVTGLLDFEFVSWDWRALDFAIPLTKYLSAIAQTQLLDLISSFSQGFAEYVRLEPNEIRMIPKLLELRQLSNVVFWVGRAYAGEEDIKTFTTRAQAYEDRIRWIMDNAEDI